MFSETSPQDRRPAFRHRYPPPHYRLAYLPFAEDHLDYIQPHTRIAVNKNTLSLSGNL